MASFNFMPGVRRNTHMLIAIAGASGSGKTYTALELATGLAGPDGKIAIIDTEAGRSLHYADQFKFDYCDLGPPFTPARYQEAIEAAENAKYDVIVVDSASHEHAGEGGLLEMAESELKKANMKSPANWAAPKAAHKKMMNRLLQCRSHIILCLRAEEKIRIEKVKDERTGYERTVVVPAGWQPICEKTVMFEMVVSFVMSPEHPGVPIEDGDGRTGKIQAQHRFAFPAGQRVTRKAGEALAKWAAGGEPPPAPVNGDEALEKQARKIAALGDEALTGWLRKLTTGDKQKLTPIGAELREIASRVDAAPEPVTRARQSIRPCLSG